VWSGGPQRAFLYAPFRPTAKFKAACGLCFNQLDGHVELPWLVRKYDAFDAMQFIILTWASIP